MNNIQNTDLSVFPLCLGGNVFGWTADEAQSFEVLDAYAAAGGNFIDTADTYSSFIPGNSGGESEQIIGNWMRERGNRDQMVIATKVGSWPEQPGLGADNIKAAVESSLRRLQTDHIDLYYAHKDDPETPLEETLGAFDELVRSGKVRHIAASNYSAERLNEALKTSERENFARYVALQPHYNLVERGSYESELQPVAQSEHLSVVPYFALASGFLTGKYRSSDDAAKSPRGGGAVQYLNETGQKVLTVLDEVAAAHDASVTTVALAWLLAKPNITAPIASASKVAQVADLVAVDSLELTAEEVAALDAAS